MLHTLLWNSLAIVVSRVPVDDPNLVSVPGRNKRSIFQTFRLGWDPPWVLLNWHRELSP